MKSSEFFDIVNTVELEERKRLQSVLFRPEGAHGAERLVELLANMASEIPIVAARTTADILIRSGVVLLEPDDDHMPS